MWQLRWQFVLGVGLSSRLISWWGQGYNGWSHVDALLADGSCLGARSDVIGNIPAGVQVRPAGYEKWKRRQVLALDCSALQHEAWLEFLNSQIGKGYDQADILGFILGRPMKTAGHWICSALQMDAAVVCGRMPRMDVTPQQVAPNALHFALLAMGAKAV